MQNIIIYIFCCLLIPLLFNGRYVWSVIKYYIIRKSPESIKKWVTSQSWIKDFYNVWISKDSKYLSIRVNNRNQKLEISKDNIEELKKYLKCKDLIISEVYFVKLFGHKRGKQMNTFINMFGAYVLNDSILQQQIRSHKNTISNQSKKIKELEEENKRFKLALSEKLGTLL